MTKVYKELRYRAVCPYCNKGFDTRKEGMRSGDGYIICADCYHKIKFKTYLEEQK